ncbi:uncharacterized protein LOC120276078 [Dioscorea cayenensis subsp. rotundata]|uniref:Uncharacterized protein LOC120276078 n=1 Tax=Dioscorea cayennensis subsp. rotundata TaxID=55577 RepID=A0AB40CI50_DIOCR|nr:uncharacterized protein LOC120276078 [Dioscorea cayenensis subsp. rotundata]
MDKSWMRKSRLSQEYEDGVEQFLNFAFANSSEDDRIICPCIKCVNIHWQTRETVLEHFVCDGIVQGYTCWFFHGERVPSPIHEPTNTFTAPSSSNPHFQTSHARPDSLEELLRDAFNIHQVDNEGLPSTTDEFNIEVNDGGEAPIEVDEQPSKEAAKFYKLLEDMNDKLYKGSQHSRLYFCIRLFHLKCMCGMTAKGLDHLIEFLKEFFSSAAILESSRESKKIIKDLGLGYEKIHSCPNDCMIYWEHNEGQPSCHICGRSGWVSTDSGECLNEDNEVVHKRPAKVLRYPDFACDPRNVRLGLSSDGFNLFKLLSTSYITWPVVLIPYNLPPWIGMKQTSFLLATIIPGDKGPRNDIDIYLQPLIKELKQLWVGVETYDASVRRNFNMRAALLWSINDFPAYANLSGWSTKGKYACPCCAAETSSQWLTNGQKFCYMAHRRWLEHNHPYISQKHLFDGNVEMRRAPSVTTGYDILLMLKEMQFSYGKHGKRKIKKSNNNNSSKKRPRQVSNIDLDTDDDEIQEEESTEASLWKKISIFFDLPYWQHNLLRHNLDVMYIEKNVCENIDGTILNVDRKSKDNLKCRLDLVDMGIRRELHPQYLPNGKTRLPPASFSMTKKEKDLFCQVLKTIKVPDAYSSNISKCVNQKERKLQSLKSHDYYILLHDLLPIALRWKILTTFNIEQQ